MDRRAWQATVCGVTRVEYHLATKPPPIRKTVNMAAKILKLCVYLLIIY